MGDVSAPAAYLIAGIPGAGKTTVSRLLAEQFPRGAHIEADKLQEMIVSGGLWPDQEPRTEAMRQLELKARGAAALADGMVSAGIVPVIDDVIVGRARVATYLEALHARPLHLVFLAPPLEVALRRDRERGYKSVGDHWAHLDAELRAKLSGYGVWIDSGELTPEETMHEILARTAGTAGIAPLPPASEAL
jgi:adenylylsulfate kinase-like enzyme